MVTRTVSWPELTWTIVSLMGFFFCGSVALNATVQLLSMRLLKINSIREYAAVTTVIAFVSWTAVQMVFAVIGIIAMVVPNPGVLSPVQYVILGFFVTGSAILSWAAFVVNRRRMELRAKIQDIEYAEKVVI